MVIKRIRTCPAYNVLIHIQVVTRKCSSEILLAQIQRKAVDFSVNQSIEKYSL